MIQALAWVTTANYVELDGILIRSGRRFHSLSARELLSFGYAWLVDGLDYKARARLHGMMLGLGDEEGRRILTDPDLPESLQGRPVPAWFDDTPDVTPPGL